MSNHAHITAGNQAEAESIEYLQQQGLKLLVKNFKCRWGEIDAVMLDDTQLVFIEVRYRKNEAFGGAVESVDTTKQVKIRKTAEYYLQQNLDIDYQQCRFDVVAISRLTPKLKLNWIQNAF